MRLGELLVKAGKITQAQLEETLKGQAIFGGKFGTNLVEMGYLDEHDLAHFLSKKTGVAHASPEQLMDVPPQVIRLIPEDAARKYRVMPVALNNRKLTLAMADPTDFATIDEISFVTGYIVVPIITPELRLVSALEKHYNIRRDLRYISVEGGGRNRARVTQAAAQQAAAQPPPRARPVAGSQPALLPVDNDILELPPLAEFECFGDMGKNEPQAPIALPKTVQREAEKEYSLEEVLQGLAQAQDRNDIAELIVNHAARRFNRSALFLLKGNKATGWVGRCGKIPVPGFDTLEIPLDEPSVLNLVSESKTYYLGPIPVTQCNSRVIAALGGGTPVNNLLVPLMMMGRVVAILYVDGGAKPLDGQVPDLQKLVGKASMAFEILILRSKILLT